MEFPKNNFEKKDLFAFLGAADSGTKSEVKWVGPPGGCRRVVLVHVHTNSQINTRESESDLDMDLYHLHHQKSSSKQRQFYFSPILLGFTARHSSFS